MLTQLPLIVSLENSTDIGVEKTQFTCLFHLSAIQHTLMVNC